MPEPDYTTEQIQTMMREYCDPKTPERRIRELEKILVRHLSGGGYERQPGEG